jgi:TolA-binding protein
MRYAFLAGITFAIAAAAADPSEQGQFDTANGLFRRSLYTEAVAEYKVYLETYPKGEFRNTALYRMGEAQYAQKDFAASLATFTTLLETETDPTQKLKAVLRQGELLYRTDKKPDAIAVLTPLLNGEIPKDVQAGALYYAGKANLDAGDAAKAIDAFKRLGAEFPDHALAPYAQFNLAFAYGALGQYESSVTEFSALAGSAKDELLRQESRYKAAETYAKLGWHEAAAKAYQQYIDEFPKASNAEGAAYSMGWAQFYGGQHASALKTAEQFIEKYPKSGNRIGAEFLRANSLQQTGKLDDALAAYEKILSEHADSPYAAKAQLKAAWTYHLREDNTKAKDEITRFLSSSPAPESAGDASFLLGKILVEEKDYEGAYAAFSKVVDQFATSEFAPDALFKAGECLLALKRVDEATRTFENFVKTYPSHELVEVAILQAGDAKFSAASFTDAIEKYKALLNNNPEPLLEEETLRRLAVTYHNIQDYKSSAETFETFLAKYPKSQYAPEAQLRIADYLLRDAKNPVDAMAKYQTAYDANRTGRLAGAALKGVALARYETKDVDGAVSTFVQVMREFPSVKLNEETYAFVGQTLFDKKKYEEAAFVLQAMLLGTPDYPNPGRVIFKIAECLELSGKIDEAIDSYTKAIDGAPQSEIASEARFRLAKIFEGRKELDKAIALYEQTAASSTGESAAQARFRLGEISEEQGNFEMAARHFMRIAILVLDEKLSPEALLRAGRCFEKASSADQARKVYRELTTDFPDSAQAAEAGKRLAELG